MNVPFYSLIFLIVFSPVVNAGLCSNCQYEMCSACNFCPNCGKSLSTETLPKIALLDAAVTGGMSALSITAFSGGMNILINTGTSNTSPHLLSQQKLTTRDKDGSYRYLKDLLTAAKAQGRSSYLWSEINSFSQASQFQNETYFLLVRAISLRNLGDLKSALTLLESCIRKEILYDSKRHLRNQVYYELSFVYFLLRDHINAVFYYLQFLTEREETGITYTTVNNAIISAIKVLNDDQHNVNAKQLIFYCLHNLKIKISHKNNIIIKKLGFN